MATIIESTDAVDATSSLDRLPTYSMSPGDTFTGQLARNSNPAPGDTPDDSADSVTLSGLVIGQTYTIEATTAEASIFRGFAIDVPDTPAIEHRVFARTGGIQTFEDNAAALEYFSVSELRVEGNTIALDITPLTTTSITLTFVNVLGSADYTLSLTALNGPEPVEIIENTIEGTEINDKLNGTADRDIMTGDAGDDQLHGKDGDDTLDGGAGKDKLTGGEGNDVARGGDGNDLLEGDAGNDDLDGGRNNDRLYGGSGNDTLTGDHGNDLLDGGDGDDILNGGIGKDLMTGGAGADIFIFEIDSHRDTITDFEDGTDLLDFSGYIGVNSAADLFISQNGAHTVITTGGPASVTLLDTDALLITDADFTF